MPNTFSAFQRAVEESLDRYFTEISGLISSKKLWFSPGYVCLYPSTVLFTETDTHYVVELLGARQRYAKLRSRRRRTASFNQLLASFKFDQKVVYLYGTGGPWKTNLELVVENLAMVNARLLGEMENRYPGIRSMFTEKSVMASDLKAWFPDNPDDEAYASLDGESIDNAVIIKNCLLSSTSGQVARSRYTSFLLAVSKRLGAEEASATIKKYLTVVFGQRAPLAGLQVVPEGKQEALILSAQFATLFLQKTKEVTLSQFLEDHSDALKVAMNADRIWYQAKLPWREGNSDPSEQYIQPDVIIRRQDGIWQIIELKLPLLTATSITRGQHKRRRFIETPYEGVSQLANYADYFRYPANIDAAEQVLGLRVTDNPQTVLIVGNAENVNETEVAEAKRGHSAVEIMSFDTLTSLLSGVATADASPSS